MKKSRSKLLSKKLSKKLNKKLIKMTMSRLKIKNLIAENPDNHSISNIKLSDFPFNVRIF